MPSYATFVVDSCQAHLGYITCHLRLSHPDTMVSAKIIPWIFWRSWTGWGHGWWNIHETFNKTRLSQFRYCNSDLQKISLNRDDGFMGLPYFTMIYPPSWVPNPMSIKFLGTPPWLLVSVASGPLRLRPKPTSCRPHCPWTTRCTCAWGRSTSFLRRTKWPPKTSKNHQFEWFKKRFLPWNLIREAVLHKSCSQTIIRKASELWFLIYVSQLWYTMK